MRATALLPIVILTAAATGLSATALGQVTAPAYRTGESWSFREINGYNNLERATVVREVISADGTTRIASRTGDGKPVDESVWATPGELLAGAVNDRARGQFDTPLQVRPFPLTEGQRWSQRAGRTDERWKERRQTRVDGQVLGWETVRVPMGEFRALKIKRVIYVGDHDPFRGESLREENEWFVPELKTAVRLTVREFYRDHPFDLNRRMLPGDWYIHELTAAKVGR